jgi:hypothetical protein
MVILRYRLQTSGRRTRLGGIAVEAAISTSNKASDKLAARILRHPGRNQLNWSEVAWSCYDTSLTHAMRPACGGYGRERTPCAVAS